MKEVKEADDRSVRSALARLSPDEIAVMQRHIRGESAVDIGLDLGIHADRVEEMFKRIMKIWTDTPSLEENIYFRIDHSKVEPWRDRWDLFMST